MKFIIEAGARMRKFFILFLTAVAVFFCYQHFIISETEDNVQLVKVKSESFPSKTKTSSDAPQLKKPI